MKTIKTIVIYFHLNGLLHGTEKFVQEKMYTII